MVLARMEVTGKGLGGVTNALWWNGQVVVCCCNNNTSWRRSESEFLGLSLAIGEKTKGCRSTSLSSLQKKEQDSPTGRSGGPMAARPCSSNNRRVDNGADQPTHCRLEHHSKCAIYGSRRPEITWKLNNYGEYTTTSAYKAQTLGTTSLNFDNPIWRPWAPRKCKTFAWLILKNRVWTSDRLATRG